MKNIFSSRWGIIATGAVIGILAVTLQKMGNPANMGICVACFERDIAGALGLHRADVVQYIRPEIAGFVLGSFVIALIKKEYQPRAGSSTILRFFLGMFAMIGALVFLGCPWRALLRLSGGDWNAIVGLAGLIAGIAVGVMFLKNGFSLGRSYKQKMSSGWVFPAVMVALLIMVAIGFRVSDTGPLFYSVKGPGAQRAPFIISLAAGLFIGAIAQRSRFCTMGSLRDIILAKDFHLASGVVTLLIFATVFNFVFGQFKPGFEGQPVAHTAHLWNFLGMALSGLAFALAGGCPGRQLILSGEGDSDAAVFVVGMIVGAGISHNFLLASSPAGPGAFGPAAVIIGFVFCLVVGFTMREKVS
ncbi:MAG TPA: YedE family putative selenium transporter [Spirochaetota bacterium]|nr:YedE family putative selenium transporter [Spirochaetota bacterium]HPF08046.1 YedE family putative selenium transporter [Spirochaetota bacterium]HPJ44245.1 YedE family putative selenium transporter [Spirochaetota bacterium]HPR39335.1 YedE family putative selenium transporter [Spirochaetota bacterium]HRX49581.1 YedE family putative selenium transporter [Spirochaetota bacterium]